MAGVILKCRNCGNTVNLAFGLPCSTCAEEHMVGLFCEDHEGWVDRVPCPVCHPVPEPVAPARKSRTAARPKAEPAVKKDLASRKSGSSTAPACPNQESASTRAARSASDAPAPTSKRSVEAPPAESSVEDTPERRELIARLLRCLSGPALHLACVLARIQEKAPHVIVDWGPSPATPAGSEAGSSFFLSRLDAGREALRRNDGPAAERELAAALALRPDSEEAWQLLAKAKHLVEHARASALVASLLSEARGAIESGDPYKARDLLRQAGKLAPGDPQVSLWSAVAERAIAPPAEPLTPPVAPLPVAPRPAPPAPKPAPVPAGPAAPAPAAAPAPPRVPTGTLLQPLRLLGMALLSAVSSLVLLFISGVLMSSGLWKESLSLLTGGTSLGAASGPLRYGLSALFCPWTFVAVLFLYRQFRVVRRYEAPLRRGLFFARCVATGLPWAAAPGLMFLFFVPESADERTLLFLLALAALLWLFAVTMALIFLFHDPRTAIFWRLLMFVCVAVILPALTIDYLETEETPAPEGLAMVAAILFLFCSPGAYRIGHILRDTAEG